MFSKNCFFVIFPATHRFCCCTLRQGSNLCTWILLVHSIFGICFTTVLVISPDDVNIDYEVLYWDRPYYTYPLMVVFLLIYIVQALACIFFMVGDCQHRSAKLKWVRISLNLSIPLFLTYVLTYVLWFVFLMFNDKQEALWSVLGPFKFAFAYCSNMTVKSYFLELQKLYPPLWQDPEDPDNEDDEDGWRIAKRTDPDRRKGFKHSSSADRASNVPTKKSKAQSMSPSAKQPSSTPFKPRTQSKVPAVPSRVPSKAAIQVRGRGRGRGKAPLNSVIQTRDRTQSDLAPGRERSQTNLDAPVKGRSRGRGQTIQSAQGRTRTQSNLANTSRERTQSNPTNTTRERTQSNPANPTRGRGKDQSLNLDRGKTASNKPNTKK